MAEIKKEKAVKVEVIVPTIQDPGPIIDIINKAWVANKQISKVLKHWMDKRLQDELTFFYPLPGFDYNNATFDTDSVRQVAMLINILTIYFEEKVLDECEDLKEVLGPIDYTCPLTTLSHIVTKIDAMHYDKITHDEEFQSAVESIIVPDISDKRPFLADDNVVAELISKSIQTYLKCIIRETAICMHMGAKRVKHDVLSTVLRSASMHNYDDQTNPRALVLVFTALYSALGPTKYVKPKK